MFNKQQRLEFVLEILNNKIKQAEEKLKQYKWKKNFDTTLSSSHFNRVLTKIEHYQDIVDSYAYAILLLDEQLRDLKYKERNGIKSGL